MKLHTSVFLAAVASMSLIGCGGSDGNSSEPQNQTPTVSISAPDEINSGETLNLSASANDTDGTITSYAWSETSGNTTIENGNGSDISLTPSFESDTTLTFSVEVTDNDGSSASAEHSVLVFADFIDPTISLDDNYDILEGEELTITADVTADDRVTYELTWSVDESDVVSYSVNDDDELSITTGEVNEDTTILANAMVSDSEGAEAEYAFTITVKNEQIETVEQAIQNMERFGKIPEMDDSDELTGGDADSNGLRDDVQAYIDSLDVTDEQRASLVVIASNIQAVMAVDLNNEQAVNSLGEETAVSVVCIAYHFDDPAEGQMYLSRIEALYANTQERSDKYEQYNEARHGAVTRLPNFSNCQ